VSNLTTLTALDLWGIPSVTIEVLRALSSSLTSLTSLDVGHCNNVTNEGLQTLSSITALSALNLYGCRNMSAAAKQALRIAIPTLTIEGFMRTLPPPCSCCHATPQRTPRSATVYSASRSRLAMPCHPICNTTVLHNQPQRCTTVSYTPHPSSPSSAPSLTRRGVPALSSSSNTPLVLAPVLFISGRSC
jgi:hypothetical protein